MKTPSIKALESAFPGKGKALKAILLMTRSELLETEAGKARDAECIRMHVLNAEAETHGVEAIRTESDWKYEQCAEYLNTGDSYAPTILFYQGNYRIQSWGDFVERHPTFTCR